MMINITQQVKTALLELLEKKQLEQGDIFVVGCSSSEVVGESIGTNSSIQAAQAVFDGLYPILSQRGIFMAAQCCEHLNRCLVVEHEAVHLLGLSPVSVVPHPKAGGSFATTAYRSYKNPAVVEHIKAHAGMDIGGTLIGMHLKEVAVPVRTSVGKVGEANLICAVTRPKYIGGPRAHYE